MLDLSTLFIHTHGLLRCTLILFVVCFCDQFFRGYVMSAVFLQGASHDEYHWKKASESCSTSADHSTAAMINQREGASGRRH